MGFNSAFKGLNSSKFNLNTVDSTGRASFIANVSEKAFISKFCLNGELKRRDV
jgi:hypothetical protein